MAACPVDRLCLYSGTGYTGTQFIAATPEGLGCGELVQPARSIINNSDTFFFVHSDTRCDNGARYIEPYSSDPDLGILARSLLYYFPF
ncbi:MAG: peptidase inhibitor family I36 protein [Actinomycetota bacterium]|nr:peptidase inhibitor family I36 protein [Actinomycetota bacterium]